MAITILDGGMGRELARMGAPFRQPEWSALALLEEPAAVARAHAAFVAAGAQVITTNSYAVVPFHLGERRFAERGEELAALSGSLARGVAAATGSVRVAGSLPPLFGSYRPDLFDAERAPGILGPLVRGLSPHVDLWLAETLGSLREAEAAAAAVAGDDRPLWISFTLADDGDPGDPPRLGSGEAVGSAAARAAELGAEVLLFNCSPPEHMGAALAEAAGRGLPTGAYANAFPPQGDEAHVEAGVPQRQPWLYPERDAKHGRGGRRRAGRRHSHDADGVERGA
jgi:S-methylmethionine-dependent homocysteine/selenocysteine methylase